MNAALIIFLIANFTTASTMAAITWLYIDALTIRIELKSVFRAVAFLLLTIAFALQLTPFLFKVEISPAAFWIQSIGLWLLFVSFMLDAHSKLQFTAVIAIIALIFLKSHAILALQTLLIAASILQIAFYTKHRDLIPLGSGFLLISAAEFFLYLNKVKGFENVGAAGSFLYIFSSLALVIWLWQYLVIRFNIKNPNFFARSR